MRIILLAAIAAMGCGVEQQQSQTKEIEGPGRARELIRNIQFSEEFENILEKFGYRRGSSCIQEVKEILPNGDEKTSFGFYSRECPNYAIAAQPKINMQLLLNPNDAKKKLFVMSGKSIAALNGNGTVDNLCFKEFSDQCTLKLDDVDGTIREIRLKTKISDLPIEARSAREKASIFVLNQNNRPSLKVMGLTEQELDLVAAYRHQIGEFTTIAKMLEFDRNLQRVPGKLLGFAQAFGLLEVASMVRDEPFQIHRIYNNCSRDVRVAIRYLNKDWQWQTTSWWKVDGSEKKPLLLGGNELFSYADTYYYYAETTEGSSHYWRGDFPFEVQGKEFNFKPLNHSEVILSCP